MEQQQNKIYPYLQRLLDGENVEWKSLGEVCDRVFAGGTPTSTKEEYYNGEIPWLRSGEINFNKIDNTEKTITELGLSKSSARWIRKNSVLLAMTGATVARSAVNNIELTANQSVCALETKEEVINYKYLYYYLASKYEYLKNQGQGVLTSLNLTTIKKLPIPLPPLSVQREIVRVLDLFTTLEAELEAELDCRKRQYEYYRYKLLNFNDLENGGGTEVIWKSLGEVAEMQRGRTITAKTAKEGKIPVISGGQKPAYFHNESNREGETITVAGSGAYAGYVMFWEEPIYVGDAFSIKPKNEEILSKYMFYFLKNKQIEIHNMKKGSGVPHVYPNDVARLEIPLPPLSVQREIVRVLDQFETLTNSISEGLPREIALRRKQYEYYRERLLSF